MFKGLGNLASMLKQAQQMGGRLQALQEELKKHGPSAAAGADLVEVEVNGLGQVLRVTLDPGLVATRRSRDARRPDPRRRESGPGQSQGNACRRDQGTDRRHEPAAVDDLIAQVDP